MFGRLIVIAVVGLIAWAVFVRSSSGAAPGAVYVVRQGDTLWSIAASHYAGDPRRAVWEIERRNGLSGGLQPGRRLVLP